MDARVRALLGRRLKVDAPERLDGAAPLRDLGVDSAGLMNLVVALEETYDIDIADRDITVENFGTLDAITGYVARRAP
ncbi:MAG: acyl carrier protein [Ilumatobacteraceae bacterium]